MTISTQYRVALWTPKGKRYAEIAGRKDDGRALYRWVKSHGLMTMFDREDASQICECARACGERAKLETVH